MIHYQLSCREGHGFDGWYASSAAFDRLAAAGHLSCPRCGTAEVGRALMAPALAKGGPATEAVAAAAPEPNVAMPDERAQKMRAAMRAMREAVLANGTDVGRQFPEEARRIHYGEAEPRGIYGQADAAEARALVEEGIAVLPLPAVDDAN